MKNYTRLKPIYLLAVISLIIIFGAFSKIAFHPNQYLLSTGGDAFKNYYTPAWYVANDNGTQFTGMNYPYGEHVVFTDNQPMISWILNTIDNNIFPIHNYTIGILNMLLLLSLWGGILILFKILRHYQLPAWYAAIMAILIGLMSPQLDRFWGHFALGYAMFVPLIWWQLIIIKKKHYALLPLCIATLTIIFFGLIHMYYVLIAALFIGFHGIVLWFSNKRNYSAVFKLFAVAAVPLLSIMLFMHLTDSVNDRPESPYGFFRYKASFQSVFLPNNGTLTNQARKIFHFGQSNPEGYAYVGYTGLIFLFIILFIYIKRLRFKKSIVRASIPLPGDMGKFLFSAVLMLLFSMTFPFNLGLQFLLDIITPLKQFRSPGRFAWGFYYVYMAVIAVLIFMLHKKIKLRYAKLAYLFSISLVALMAIETYIWFNGTATRMQEKNAENPFNGKNTYFSDMFLGTSYTADDFDAIVFLPSFFQGSEKLYIDRTRGNFAQAMEMSYQTGLPLVNYMSSRTSFSQTLNNVQLVSHPYINNKTEGGVFNAKRLLIITKPAPMTAGEQYIIDHAVKFSTREAYTLYAFETSALTQKGDALAIADYLTVSDTLQDYISPTGTPYRAEQPLTIFYRNGFENFSGGSAFIGSGAFCSDKKVLPMAEIPVEPHDTIWIEISFWAKSDINSMAYPYIDLGYYDQNGKLLRESSVAPTQSTDVMDGWVRASENLELLPDVYLIKVRCSDDSPVNFDELVIRHTAFNAYYDVVSDKNFVVNNFRIGK